ncbi:hypothetical protein, partial [Pantoea sp. ME81]|uniref:hypothetical protein n=1 Tax=Pantoea sp. ME81 TaxID=2743935 RepID=UPI0015F3954A
AANMYSGADELSLHVAITISSAGGVGLPDAVIDEMLAHSGKTGIQQTYIVNDVAGYITPDAEAAFIAWGEWLQTNVITPPPTADITPFRRKKA